MSQLTLIVDSGSTKTDLRWLLEGKNIYTAATEGINPFYQQEEEILQLLENCCPKEWAEATSRVFFYGAGCSFPEKCDMVRRPLCQLFSNASSVEVVSDLVGAARALLQRHEGIACILGTGSNSCHYDGQEIKQNVSPLGFILGDEGSGAVLGKLLIADILKGMAPDSIVEAFWKEEKETPASIMERIYKRPFPNRFLAQFTRFIHRHKEDPYCKNLLQTAFNSFFQRNIAQYPKHLPVGFIGSIAYYFEEEIRHVAQASGYTIATIEKSPMEGLIRYHT